MKEKLKWQLVLALYGLVALLWIGQCVSTLRYGPMDFVQLLCAVAWSVLFLIQLRRYRRERDGKD